MADAGSFVHELGSGFLEVCDVSVAPWPSSQVTCSCCRAVCAVPPLVGHDRDAAHQPIGIRDRSAFDRERVLDAGQRLDVIQVRAEPDLPGRTTGHFSYTA